LFHIPCYTNHFDGLYLLLTTFHQPINQKDRYGMTALHLAAYTANIPMLILLLHNRANLLVTTTLTVRSTPLHMAIIQRHLHVVTLIIGQFLERYAIRSSNKYYNNNHNNYKDHSSSSSGTIH
jgi:ankyrin repeat protein